MKKIFYGLAAILLVSCQNKTTTKPEEVVVIAEDATTIHNKLSDYLTNSLGYMEVKQKLEKTQQILWKQKRQPTADEDLLIQNSTMYLEENYERSIVPRDEIFRYVSAILEELPKQGLVDSLMSNFKSNLGAIAPGIDDSQTILEASDNLVKLASSPNVDMDFQKHFVLLQKLLKIRDQARGI